MIAVEPFVVMKAFISSHCAFNGLSHFAFSVLLLMKAFLMRVIVLYVAA
jgi:hypothetical protein